MRSLSQPKAVMPMFKESVVLGQYYPVDSLMHRLDGRNKIIITLLYLASLFVASRGLDFAILTLLFVLMVVFSRVPVRLIWRGLRFVIIVVLLTVIFNIFFYPGEEIWRWGILRITREGISHGLLMGLRILLLISAGPLLTLTTKPMDLTDAMERLLSPLQIIRVPAHEIAMVMSIALRFIPTLMEELERIILAQRARGASFADKKLGERMRQILPLVVPLFVSAFRRADELAQAMEAKCYHGGKGRSHWRRSRWQLRDTLVFAFFVLVLAYMIYGRVCG